MNKKTVLRCGTVVLLCLVALSAVWMGAGSQQVSAASQTHATGSTGAISSVRRATDADVIAYWTADRMKSARPLNMQLKKASPVPSSSPRVSSRRSGPARGSGPALPHGRNGPFWP